jgi:hypothetical protein
MSVEDRAEKNMSVHLVTIDYALDIVLVVVEQLLPMKRGVKRRQTACI